MRPISLNGAAIVERVFACARLGIIDEGSLSSDSFVLGQGDVLANTTESSNFVTELLGGVDAFTHGQGVGVVVELQLILASHSIVNGTNTRVLLVQPRTLHISLLLGIVGLRVDLANQVRDLVDTLALHGSQVVAGLVAHGCLEASDCLSGALSGPLTKVVPVFSAEVTSVHASGVSGDDGAETLGGGLDGSVDKGQFCDVVLIDHAKNGLLLTDVDLRVLNFLLVRCFELPL
jgi:hypothetical protein